MPAARGNYLFVIPVPAYPLEEGRFAIEGAFAEHLEMLRHRLGDIAQRIVLVAPRMPEADYRRMKDTLAVLDEARDAIRLRPAHRADAGKLAYAKDFPRVMSIVFREVTEADVVHSGPSGLFRPFELPALLLARALGKKSISVTDIDHRQSPRMAYEAGHLDLKAYLVNRLLHVPFMDVQHRLVARACSLVLLKGRSLSEDYGNGRPNVRDFLDAAFSEHHVIDEHSLQEKTRAVLEGPVRLTYFGRLVPYKGVDHLVRAFAAARERGVDAELHIVGEGVERARLEALAEELGIEGRTIFHGAIPFGDRLFSLLRTFHLLLAAPLAEDTPRSALDGMASGQAVIAYDATYYRELARAGAPVDLVPWNDIEALGRAIELAAGDRPRLAMRMRDAVRFARENTQEIWLDRRAHWTRALFESA
jgi:glycosyltransferase involved in cell wall biosynthesis